MKKHGGLMGYIRLLHPTVTPACSTWPLHWLLQPTVTSNYDIRLRPLTVTSDYYDRLLRPTVTRREADEKREELEALREQLQESGDSIETSQPLQVVG